MAIFAASITVGAWPARAGDVLVFAAASTAAAVEAVAALYGRRAGDTAVRTVFAASSTLARQIANGAPADIYLSANRKWMDWLADRKLIDPASRRDLFGNRLVLIAPLGSPLRLDIRPGFALARHLGDGRLALADPDHVPAGIYARQALEALGVWHAVGPRAARARDVRGALALVERGAAPAGIVYATDARNSRRVTIVGRFPARTHAPIRYTVALVPGRNGAAPRAFLAFLTSKPALAVFARHGFTVE